MAIVFLGIAWLVGIWLASLVDVPLWLLVVVGATALLAAIIIHRQRSAGMWLAMIGILCLGAARYASAEPTIDQAHVAYYNGKENVSITGVVVNEPEISDRIVQLTIKTLTITGAGGTPQPVEGLILVNTPKDPAVPYGAKIQLTGQLKDPENFDDFDYKSHLARQQIYSQMLFPTISVLSKGHGNPIYYGIYAVKELAQESINSLLPNPHAALLSGILLGNDNELPPDLEDAFRTTGMSHIIAISGFNIAIMAAILLQGSRPLVGLRGSAWVALVGIGLYTLLVGADPAVVRAAIMGSLFIIAARFLGRPTYAPAGLFAAVIAMTLLDPNIIWNIGFQLSFMATLGLMLYVGPWSQWSEARAQRFISPDLARRVVSVLGDIAIATLAALLLTIPLMAHHFGQLSLVSPLANLFILPAQAGIMTWGILATAAGMLIQPLGQLLAWIAWLFLEYTIELVRFFATLPAASIEVATPLIIVIAAYILIFGASWFSREIKGLSQLSFASLWRSLRWGSVLSVLIIITALVVALVFSQPDGNLHVSFIDVGQGDATLITTPSGRQILVDGGAFTTVVKGEIGQRVPFWDKGIDIIVASHADSDHIAALPSLFEHYDVGRLITNGLDSSERDHQALMTAADAAEIPVHTASVGEVIIIDDGVRLEILNTSDPGSPIIDPQLDNDASVALRLSYGDFSLLLTGDAGKESELAMAGSRTNLASVVYKVGHHGSDTSSSMPFLWASSPQLAIISSGADNQYGHPHPDVLGRLSAVGAAILRTDELGTIEVTTDGRVMWWQAG